MNSDLIRNLAPYKQTATFTEGTIPAGLLKEHSTKEGVWGLIHVEEGKLRYVVADPRRAPADAILTPDMAPGVVEPTILHWVEPIGAVKFHVQFLRNPQHGSTAATPTHREEQT